MSVDIGGRHDLPPGWFQYFQVSPELRRAFESDLWALLPLDVPLLRTIINTDFTVDKPIETVYEGMDVFDYAFVPLPGMSGIITRLVEQDSLPDALPQEHTFPYTTLPVLHLQVQPHYVVFDLCRKILKHELILIDIREETIYEPSFMKYTLAHITCRNLYNWWMTSSIPPSFIEDSGDDILGRVALRKRYPDNFVDKVALRPTDSVTHVPDGEDGEDSGNDDADEFIVDESDSAFQVRMTRWVADLEPGLPEALNLDVIDLIQTEATQDGSDGSPTMVGSILLPVDTKLDCTDKSQAHDLDLTRRTKSISHMLLGSSALLIV
ncbi:hypothetical protein C0993_011053 [Termitomyces sp. T159_Od127]|nr:hypothetical protein C0993_011053 [Termitomyces sp. T159_Od127]